MFAATAASGAKIANETRSHRYRSIDRGAHVDHQGVPMSAVLITVLFAAALAGALFAGALWLRQEFQKASAETIRSSQDQFLRQATATFDLAQERTQGRLDL